MWRFSCWFLLAGTLLGQAPSAERWRRHLTEELLPFWSQPSALGTPVGNFPTSRCDDGSPLDLRRPCAGFAGVSWLLDGQKYMVAQSRQTYAYCVAFHVTGERQYLDWCKAGVDYIRRNAVERSTGSLYTRLDTIRNVWGPRTEFRNAQELAYGLLGMTMYYYLTRDSDVLVDILRAKDFILGKYYSPASNSINWLLDSNGSELWYDQRLVAQLDQMNGYLVLLSTTVPEPIKSELRNSMSVIARLMIDQFYSAKDNLFFLSANARSEVDSATADTDFGHTIKAMWMIRFTGRLTGEQDLVEFGERNGRRVLERAFLADGTWACCVGKGPVVNPDKTWWIYAELDQFASSLWLSDPAMGRYLEKTAPWWFENFVDKRYGEVWTELNAKTLAVQGGPKQWPWKNGYHSFEHALVGHITAKAVEGGPVELYYAFPGEQLPADVQPYYFRGDVAGATAKDGVWRVQFSGVN